VIYILDPEGNFTSYNPAHERLTGYDPEELSSMHFMQLIAPEDLGRVQDDLARRLAGGADDPIAVQIVTKDGRRRFVEATVKVVDAEDGPVRVAGIVRWRRASMLPSGGSRMSSRR
jgi:PAS domain S-box-containing protein